MDWQTWHNDYDHPNSWMAKRLKDVQQQIKETLTESPPGQLSIISLCAGQGRDLLEVLPTHPRRNDIQARLVELDPRNTAIATAANTPGVEVVTADASWTDHYLDRTPADLVLLCGIFGNITDDDIHRTISFCPQLCKTGGTVIWTRHRDAPDRVPRICEWFEEIGFERRWLSDQDAEYGVGVHRFTNEPRPLVAGQRMFTFVGYEALGPGKIGT